MSEQYRQLVFRPAQQHAALAEASLVAVLSKLGLIGERISDQWPQRYYIGERFLQYLNFMGCAPALEFLPAETSQPDWSAFTFISITAPARSPRCLVDTMMAKPGCPHCGKRHAMASQQSVSTLISLPCPKCQRAAAIADWDWREFGGCARQFISIVNVYTKEALPTDSLLQQMRDKTDIDWRYFYINDQLLDVTN